MGCIWFVSFHLSWKFVYLFFVDIVILLYQSQIIHLFIFFDTRLEVKKVLRLKIYLPRQKWIINETSVFLEIFSFAFHILILVSFPVRSKLFCKSFLTQYETAFVLHLMYNYSTFLNLIFEEKNFCLGKKDT